MRKNILGLIILFSILNVVACIDFNDIEIMVTLFNIALTASLSASISGCILSLNELKENTWLMNYCLLMISTFALALGHKFGLIMAILSLALIIHDRVKKKK